MVYKKKVGGKKRIYRRKARVPSTKKKMTFDKRVKTVISRMAENKNQNFKGSVGLVPYGNANWGSTITPCSPDTLYLTITQGVGQGDRVGNSIRVKSLKFSGVLRALAYDSLLNPTPVPHYVKMFFLTRKDTPTDIYSGFTDVLQFGNNSEGPGNASQLRNLYRPVNTDAWTVHTTRIFKLGYSIYQGTGANTTAQFHSNNDFKLNQFVNVDLTKYCTKIIKFDDNTANPSTRNIVMYPVIYTADGSPVSSKYSALDYSLDIVYEDM